MKKFLQTFLGLSLLGWVNALYSLYHRQSLYAQGLTKPSFCNIGDSFNCDAAALSRWSAFFGMPTSALGLVFYSLLVLLVLWGLTRIADRKEDGLNILSPLLLGLTSLALVPTLALAYISFTSVKTLCLMCLFSYLINLALWVCAWQFHRRVRAPWSTLKNIFVLPTSLLWTFLALAGLQLFLPKIFTANLRQGGELSAGDISTLLERHYRAPVQELNLVGRPTRGGANAKVTIVVFSDFQCPFCAREALTTPQLIQQYGEDVKIVFKNFPLDAACNPHAENTVHPLACLAAKSAYCVFKAKGAETFFKLKEKLFSEQEKLSNEFIKKTSVQFGLSEAELQTCVSDFNTHQYLVEDAQDGNRVKVTGTPTVFVNGKVFEAAAIPEVFQTLLRNYLGAKTAK